jgi:hypothetical protein
VVFTHIAATALLFGAGYLLARHRPDRNGFVFALAATVLYTVIDVAAVGFVGLVSLEFGLSMLAKLGAGRLRGQSNHRSSNN